MQLKHERPSRGAPKIREKLRRLHSDVQLPAISTVHAVLDRHGLVNRRRRRRRHGHKAEGTPRSRPGIPNDLWCADYKGEFMLADRRYCYPAELYEPSPRPYQGLTELEYPFHHRTITVTRCGRICFGRQKINLSTVFAGQNISA